jgi:dienelactone hydrolase
MAAHGVREELKDMARRLATVGDYVLLPNLYGRARRDTGYGPDVQEEGSAENKRMRAVRTKMTIPPVIDDIGAMFAFTEQHQEVKRGAVGCHGYSIAAPTRWPLRRVLDQPAAARHWERPDRALPAPPGVGSARLARQIPASATARTA